MRRSKMLPPALSINPYSTAMVFLLIISIMFKFGGIIPNSSLYGSIPKVDNPKIQNFDYNLCIEPILPLVVSIDKNLRVFISNKATTPSHLRIDLQNAVSSYRKQHPVNGRISLNVDKRVPMGKISELIKLSQSLGIEQFGFIVEVPRLPCQ